jgi:hypothetical protein
LYERKTSYWRLEDVTGTPGKSQAEVNGAVLLNTIVREISGLEYLSAIHQAHLPRLDTELALDHTLERADCLVWVNVECNMASIQPSHENLHLMTDFKSHVQIHALSLATLRQEFLRHIVKF